MKNKYKLRRKRASTVDITAQRSIYPLDIRLPTKTVGQLRYLRQWRRVVETTFIIVRQFPNTFLRTAVISHYLSAMRCLTSSIEMPLKVATRPQKYSLITFFFTLFLQFLCHVVFVSSLPLSRSCANKHCRDPVFVVAAMSYTTSFQVISAYCSFLCQN